MDFVKETVQFSSLVRLYDKNKKTLIGNMDNNTCLVISKEIADIFSRFGFGYGNKVA